MFACKNPQIQQNHIDHVDLALESLTILVILFIDDIFDNFRKIFTFECVR